MPFQKLSDVARWQFHGHQEATCHGVGNFSSGAWNRALELHGVEINDDSIAVATAREPELIWLHLGNSRTALPGCHPKRQNGHLSGRIWRDGRELSLHHLRSFLASPIDHCRDRAISVTDCPNQKVTLIRSPVVSGFAPVTRPWSPEPLFLPREVGSPSCPRKTKKRSRSGRRRPPSGRKW
jgi:hypothetical protein